MLEQPSSSTRLQKEDASTLRSNCADLLRQGEELHRQGKLAAAAELYRQAVSLDPASAEGWAQLGEVALAEGFATDAVNCLEKSLALRPESAETCARLGQALSARGEPRRALASFEQSLRVDATQASVWAAMAGILIQLGEQSPATDCLRQALMLDPDNIDALLLLANLLRQHGDAAQAEANYRKSLRQDPDNVPASVNLATLIRGSGRLEESLGLLRSAALRCPEMPAIRFNLANSLTEAGRFEEARKEYEGILESHPEPAKIFYNLSTITRFDEAHRHKLRRWSDLARQRQGTRSDRVYLQFALGKAYDDLGEYRNAMEHYERANVLAAVPFDADAHHRSIRRTIQTFDRSYFTAERATASQARPIFLVGMPRSGTTLIERLLAKHPEIHAAGERTELGLLITAVARKYASANDLADVARTVSKEDLALVSKEYESLVLKPHASKRVLDKMPTNFLHLGWIACCFPNAVILHCRRDPRDTCLSCYFQHFTQRLPFTYNLDHLVSYYRDYELLMSHWAKTLPIPIVDVQYEEVVADPDKEMHRLWSACGLEAPQVVEEHLESSQLVQTASHWQSRQPIYRTSCARWKNYADEIPQLIEAFGDDDLNG